MSVRARITPEVLLWARETAGFSIEEEQYQQEEVFCNAFAGFFLVPNDDFVVAKNPSNQEISRYANQYKVSREVILRKYLNKRLITQDFYNKKIKEWKEQP